MQGSEENNTEESYSHMFNYLGTCGVSNNQTESPQNRSFEDDQEGDAGGGFNHKGGFGNEGLNTDEDLPPSGFKTFDEPFVKSST
jgi:hypothetical protein